MGDHGIPPRYHDTRHTGGQTGDMFGRVRMYNLGFASFTFGSLLCAFSSSGPQLIGFRVVQGLGGALIFGERSFSMKKPTAVAIDSDGEVDEEDIAPAQEGDEGAADEDSQYRAQRIARARDSVCSPPLALRESVGDDRSAVRVDQGTSQPLHHAEADELGPAGRKGRTEVSRR